MPSDNEEEAIWDVLVEEEEYHVIWKVRSADSAFDCLTNEMAGIDEKSEENKAR